ncbi:MAG: PAS domain S-box protein [Chloroflexota bacterium]
MMAAIVIIAGLIIVGLLIYTRKQQSTLRRSVKHYQSLFEAQFDGIVVINTQGVIEQVNPATCRMFGYKPDQLLGHRVGILMPESIAQEHQSYIARYLQAGQGEIIGVGPRLVDAVKYDGTQFPVELTIVEVVNGKRVFLGIIRDRTEVVRLNQELQQALELFEKHITSRAKKRRQLQDSLGVL